MPARRRRSSSTISGLSPAEERLAAQAIGAVLSTPRGRRFFFILLIVALLVLLGWWLWQNELRPRHPVGPTVRIATWNLRQFSESRREVNLRAIADVIKSSHFDVVAVQEIKRNGEQLDRLLNVLGTPWRSSSLSDLTGNHERFAFIYDSDHVQEIGTAHFIATVDAVIFDRVPYQQTFRAGNFDFTLITCHLYYGDGREGRDRRRKEAEALARFATRYAESQPEHDVILLGDFNETRGSQENLQLFVSQGWQLCNSDPTNLGGNEVYDNLLIEPKYTKEWTGTGGSIRFDQTMFNNDDKRAMNEVSDHRPAYADFVTNLPDDD